MRPVTRRIGIALIVAAGGLAGSSPLPAPNALGPASAEAACRTIMINGKRKCTSAGHGSPCSPRYQSDYRRYGYRCVRDRKGRYRLR